MLHGGRFANLFSVNGLQASVIICQGDSILKRRALISLGVGGVVTVLGHHYWGSSFGQTADESRSADVGLTEYEPVDGEPLLRFIAMGDVGTGDEGQYAVADAMRLRWQMSPFAIALMAGDNIYNNGAIGRIGEVFERPYGELLQSGVKFYATLGNHDVRSEQGRDQVAYPGYNMAGRYYTFTQGMSNQSPSNQGIANQPVVQFFALDTNQIYLNDKHRETPWPAQLTWLEDELARSSAVWKVVFAHHPVYSSGRHGSERDLMRALSPLFESYGVQLYINGHDHHYERTVPINGTTYVTSGNGAKLRRSGSSRWTAHASSQLGFTAFDVYDDRMVIKAIDTANAVYDESSVMKVL